MDVDSSGVWGKRKVAVISGCMENQLSEDSGDGGVMTNALLKVIRRKIAKLREAFRQFDVDDSGTLSADELAQLLTRGTSSGTPLSAEDAQEIIDDFDTDGDGVLSLDELARAWVEITGGDEEVEEHEVVPGQHVTLSWPGGCDPSKFPFPF
ncbi:calmodulin cam1 [Chrysochromulina tobinii]|uniref:Calmodulin cam1 n=1 Tax=Chrysochromulina tobinii TaxID=1460289 RepID=A0A0M0K7J7_9EUKA|nr:calmodulin cam1 [Chrysochromulina tobinii]|eukprot:KOO34552.1 calmodulin cam1 [Chrysochromulina sp. CCMP291]